MSRLALGLGTATAAFAVVALVAVAAAWMLAGALSAHPGFRTKLPTGLQAMALPDPFRPPFDAAEFTGSTEVAADPAPAVAAPHEAEPLRAAAPASAPSPAAPRARQRTLARVDSVQLPAPRPAEASHRQAQPEARQEVASFSRSRVAPQVATAAPLAPASNYQKPSPLQQQAHNNSISLPTPDSRTAIYDIAAHTVYLPNGDRLEAHSGLGRHLDDPHSVDEKNRGATPPNTYDLVLREQPFHGVRAIRLNPVGDARMFGRDGILAHTYMLGPSGQSFGCVSFKDYSAFLRAFLKGEVNRLVVVPRLGTPVLSPAMTSRGHSRWYALNNP